MKLIFNAISAALACIAHHAALTEGGILRNNPPHRNLKKATAPECTVMVAQLLEIKPGTIEDEIFECEMDPQDTNGIAGLTRRISGTDEQKNALKNLLRSGDLVPGHSKLKHGAGAPFDDKDIFIPPGLDVASSLGNGKEKGNGSDNGNGRSNLFGRRRLSKFGDQKVLFVKVIDRGGLTYPHSEAVMSDNVFGTSGDPVNLKSQLAGCSFDQINFSEEFTAGIIGSNEIEPGVMNVNINLNISDASEAGSRGTVRNAITTAVQTKLNFTLPGDFDYVMYSLEKCYHDCGWAAYAYINSWNSVYQGGYYYMTGVLVHELGHNFGLAHSGGLNGATYTDHTCMMGNPLYSDDVGRMCFNPAKSWQMGWYDDRHLTLSPIGAEAQYPQTIEMVGLADYQNNPQGFPVQLKIETGTSTDFYIGFNRATGVNADNDEADNEVTIIEMGGNGNSYSQSYLKAHLIQGESYTISNLGGASTDVTITAEGIDLLSNPAVAYIKIEADLAPTASPTTAAPTQSPTPFQCNDIVLEVDVLTDNYPGETSWTLTNECTSATQASRARGYYPSTGTQYSDQLCVPSGEYTFTISDSYGDGICCGYGQGAYEVRYDSAVVKQGGAFTSAESSTFGSCFVPEPTSSPTKSPTAPPTKDPTASPVASPTKSPTAPPTKDPTSSPVASPTKSPTAPPTKDPTASPVASPTQSPTTSPTKNPSGSPTASPSKNPTTSPTKNPTGTPTKAPTKNPTVSPTISPTKNPTTSPTSSPTKNPTTSPTKNPSGSPTASPSKNPTTSPTKNPTGTPTKSPTRSPTQPSPSPTHCGVVPGTAINGNGICEDGETCLNSSDCEGVVSGKQSSRYCCHGGPSSAVEYAVGCSDSSTCGGNGCDVNALVDVQWCCGDGICTDGGEDFTSCPEDCPAPEPTSPPTPSPTGVNPPPTKSPTPLPTPPPVGGGCPVCSETNAECCGECKTNGSPSSRGCIV